MVVWLAGAAYAGYKYGKKGLRKARALRKCKGKKGKALRKCRIRALKK